MDLLRFAAHDLDDAVKQEAGRNAVGNAVAVRHEDAGEEAGDRVLHGLPLDVLERAEHHDADDDQRRGDRRIRNRADDGREERADDKQDRRDHAGQPGAPANADSGRAFHISGGVGGAEDRADRGGGGVCEQGAVHFRLKTAVAAQRQLVLHRENPGLAACSDEGSDCVECVGKAECEDCQQYKRNLGCICEQ